MRSESLPLSINNQERVTFAQVKNRGLSRRRSNKEEGAEMRFGSSLLAGMEQLVSKARGEKTHIW